MDISTPFVVGIALFLALFVPYAIFHMRRGKDMDTRGSHCGSRAVTRTSARTWVDLD